MVFDRRYLLSRAALEFDGGLDPLLDIQMSHEFTDVTMYVGIRGRLTNPDLQLTSSPAAYSEGQLLGFLLGGTPGAAGQDTKDALTGAAASVASQTVGGFVTRRLPVKVDVLRFEPATGSSSASFVAGKWVNEKLLVMIRSRIGPREDENNAETEVEYWLGRRILLDGVAGNKSVLGLDLLWTRRW
jgi:autotransporter translocation and assembly factor TamB